MDLAFSTYIIQVFVFGLVNLLLIPDSKSLRLILFISLSLLLWATIYNLEISKMETDSTQEDITVWVTLFIGQFIYYGGICLLMITARGQLIETIHTNKEQSKYLATILDNLQESIIILKDNQIDFANDTFLCKFSGQLLSSNSIELNLERYR